MGSWTSVKTSLGADPLGTLGSNMEGYSFGPRLEGNALDLAPFATFRIWRVAQVSLGSKLWDADPDLMGGAGVDG